MDVTEKKIKPGEPGWLSAARVTDPTPKWDGTCKNRGDVPSGPTTAYLCTRLEGHSGDHAWHSMDTLEQLATWPQEPEHPVLADGIGWVWCNWGGIMTTDKMHNLQNTCPGPHYTVLRGDLIEPPHVHDLVAAAHTEDGRVGWVCRTCPDFGGDDLYVAWTQAPKPGEGS